MNNLNNNEGFFQQEMPYDGRNGHIIIQEFINNYHYSSQGLINLLEHGYQVTYEDRKIMQSQLPLKDYKYYATHSRLAFRLYQQGHPELISILFASDPTFSGTIYTIESLLFNKPEYFDFETNVWVANNAINLYKAYWIFCEAALRQSGKWEEIYQVDSFSKKYNELDKDAILQWRKPKEYKILKLLYPQLQVPIVQFLEEEQSDIHQTVNSLFYRTELSDILQTLSINIEKQRPVWGYHHIDGTTAEEKVNALWHTLPHEEFFDALFYLANYKHASFILNQLIKYVENEVKDAIYVPDTLYKLQIGLENGKIKNPDFLLLLWELGYRHKTLEDWQKGNALTSSEKMQLYCLDKLFNNRFEIDLKDILNNTTIQAIGLIEDIKNNRIVFTNQPNWKSRINNIRSLPNHPLNDYWEYIDIALDNFHAKNGQSMRNYLCQKQPGIKLEKKDVTIIKESNFYKALTILYPDIYN